jgi:hypothetical protein
MLLGRNEWQYAQDVRSGWHMRMQRAYVQIVMQKQMAVVKTILKK